jgi:hypothetical protein
MGLITEGFSTVVEVTRQLDGRIWDYATQSWIAPTEVSIQAANTAVDEIVASFLDLIPFPISASVLGIFTLTVDRAKMEGVLDKVQGAVRKYVNATKKM